MPKSLSGKVTNYATKLWNKNRFKNSSIGVYTRKFSKKVVLASLKSEIDKSNIGKLEITPVDLRKLSDVVKMKLLKRLYMIN